MTVDRRINEQPSLGDLVFADGTPRKALYTALVVGTVLTAINHGDSIYNGNSPSPLKILLTYCVPYCVTTWGAATGKLAQWSRDQIAEADQPRSSGEKQ